MYKYKESLMILVLVFFMIISAFGIANSRKLVSFQQDTIAELDKKEEIAEKLIMASTTASVGLSLLPGDVATPLAEKFADISIYMVIIITSIYLQKWIIGASGLILFRGIIPFFCIVLLFQILIFRSQRLMDFACKVLIVGLSISLFVPISIMTSKSIDQTTAYSVELTNKRADEAKQRIEEKNTEAGGIESKFAEFIGGIKNGIKQNTIEFERTYKNVCSSIASMIVTTCCLPLLFLWFLFKILNALFETKYSVPKWADVDKIRQTIFKREKDLEDENNKSGLESND